MPFSAYVFDLDGTLVDSLGDLADSMNHVLEARGLPTHPEDAYRHFVGDGVRALVERSLPAEVRENDETVDEVLAAYRSWYGDHMFDRTTTYPGIRPLLEQLAADRRPLAVLSNKPDGATRQVVDQLFPDTPFLSVLGARDGVPRKPDPSAALEALAVLGTRAEETAFVGDSDTDMLTARNAGLVPVGAAWGFRGREELLRAGARWVCETPEELAGLPEVAPPEPPEASSAERAPESR